MVSLEAAEIEAALFALGDIDDNQNKLLDVNSLTTALEEYFKKRANPSQNFRSTTT